MAVGVAAMGPVLVHDRWVTSEVLAGHCSKKGCRADHRLCALVDVSLFVAAGRAAPQVQQQQHLMRERDVVRAEQAGLQQVNLFPYQADFEQAVLVEQEGLVYQLSPLLVGAHVHAPDPSQQVCHFFLQALWGAEMAHNEVHTHPHCPHLIPQCEMADVSFSVYLCHS